MSIKKYTENKINRKYLGKEIAMSSIVALKGMESEKIVDGSSQMVNPFVGADRPGDFSSFGIGYSVVETGRCAIWGLVAPHSLIRSWRGMKLLEKVPQIEHGTLCACWTVCVHDSSKCDQRYRDDLAKQFASREEFENLLGELLSSVPTQEELDSMIAILVANEIDVAGWEFTAEISDGRLEMTDQIQAILDSEEVSRKASARKKEECEKPIPREESLSAFFEDLDMDHFIIGGGIGAYGMDWGHIDRKELDRLAREDSFSKYLKDGHRLEKTTSGPKTTRMKVDEGMTAYQTSFGNIEQPTYRAEDGVLYTFVYAKWVNGLFYIRTLVEQEEVMVPQGATEYTIAQLRSMLNVKPKKKSLFKKICSMVSS